MEISDFLLIIILLLFVFISGVSIGSTKGYNNGVWDASCPHICEVELNNCKKELKICENISNINEYDNKCYQFGRCYQ